MRSAQSQPCMHHANASPTGEKGVAPTSPAGTTGNTRARLVQIGEAVDGVQRQLSALPQRQEVDPRPVRAAETVAAPVLLACYWMTLVHCMQGSAPTCHCESERSGCKHSLSKQSAWLLAIYC